MVNIDYNKLGYEFYKTFIYFRSFDKSEESRLINYAKNQKNIIHLIKQISPWDIELEIMCQSYHEYNQIINELTRLFPNIIQKVDTAIISENYEFASKQLIFE
jgi:DNA-binding Lrp family transcriptional regulator